MDILSQEDCFSVMHEFFRNNSCSSQAIKSFNIFVQEGIQRIIAGDNVLQYEHKEEAVLYEFSFIPESLKIVTPRAEYLRGENKTDEQKKAKNKRSRYRLLYPAESRLRKMNYEAGLFISINLKIFKFLPNTPEPVLFKENTLHDIRFGNLPVMTKSVLCNTVRDTSKMDAYDIIHHNRQLKMESHSDPGGYFISKGSEKVLISQEKQAPNKIHVFPYKVSGKDKENKANNLSQVTKKNENGDKETISRNVASERNPFASEITSIDLDSGKPRIMKVTVSAMPLKNAVDSKTIQSIGYRDEDTLVLMCSFSELDSKYSIPLPVVLRALGLTTDIEIIMYITKDVSIFFPEANIDDLYIDSEEMTKFSKEVCRFLGPTFEICENYTDRAECLEYVFKKTKNFSKSSKTNVREEAYNYMETRFLPHVNPEKGVQKHKGRFICEMARRVCRCMQGLMKGSQRDSLQNKRLDCAGELMYSLFRGYFRSLKNRLFRQIDKHFEIMHRRKMTNGKGAKKALDVSGGISGQILHFVRSFFQNYTTNLSSMNYAIATGNWCQSASDSHKLADTYKGVAQQMNNLNGCAKESQLMRVRTPMSEQSKNTKARALHSSTWGTLCPAETPEGGSVGLTKNMSWMAHVSTHTPLEVIEYIISGMSNLLINETIGKKPVHVVLFNKVDSEVIRDNQFVLSCVPIEVNGFVVGMTNTPGIFTNMFRFLRRFGSVLFPNMEYRNIPQDCSIRFDVQEHYIYIRSDAGRLCRPLFVTDPLNTTRLFMDKDFANIVGHTVNGIGISEKRRDEIQEKMIYYDSFLTEEHQCPYSFVKREAMQSILDKNGKFEWQDFFKFGMVELVDTMEVENAMISMYPSDLEEKKEYCRTFTHCEFHPSVIFGATASLIPFSDHNQSPRNMYQCAMGKQAQKTETENTKYRIDNTSYNLWYGQKPLVTTRQANMTGKRETPTGMNAIVLIACYGGFNQEDSVLMNQSAIDRGLFRSNVTETITVKCENSFFDRDQNGITIEEFEKPDPREVYGMRSRHKDYEKIDSDGFPFVGEMYGKGDVIIGKVKIHDEQVQMTRRGPFTFRKTDHSICWKKDIPVWCEDVILTTTDQGQKTVHVKLRSCRVPQIGDKFCLTPDHDVQTLEDGWIPISKVTKQHKIACLDPETNHLVYDIPTEIFEYDHEGQMYHVSNQQIDTTVTLNHKLYVQKRGQKNYQLLEAEKIFGKKVRFKKDCVNPNKESIETTIKGLDRKIPTSSFLKFVGVWLAEGWCEKVDYRIVLSADKPRVQRLLKKECAEMGLHITENRTKWIIYNKAIWNILKPLSVGAPNKFIPRKFLSELGTQNCRDLIEGMLCGDGHRNNYYTSSKQLRDDFQQLCHHAGWSATFALSKPEGIQTVMKDGRVITSRHDHWKLGVVKTRNNPQINHGQTRSVQPRRKKRLGHIHEQKIQKEEIIDYKGKIYCVNVPTHIFYVRRNGKPMWTGNSSRHGQKGTVGMTYRQEDLPWTKDGLVPDIIVNPHAIPSRMTIGQLIEAITGSVACLSKDGTEGDGTAFTDITVQEISQALHEHGFQREGKQVFYSGLTGQQLHGTMLFVGPTYYQRLKHMVDDKIQARSRGPTDGLTRQPLHGKARGGGIRFGEMERDCAISHGAAMFMRDRLFECSDKYNVPICSRCGLLAIDNKSTKRTVCKRCRSVDTVSRVDMPYAMKLLTQELYSMGLAPRFFLK